MRINRIFNVLACALALVHFHAACNYAHAQPSSAGDALPQVVDSEVYAKPQRLVEVEPGRRLNLFCEGTGSPTVIFESGLGVMMGTWGLVQPVIAQKTATCAYNRAGMGFSDVATRPSTSQNIVDDLHRLLVAASIKPPYVMIGHSSGGLNARLFTYTFPSEVIGMVLIDPTVEDQAETYRALDPQKRTVEQWFAYTLEPTLRSGRECVAGASAGFVPGSELLKKCVPGPFDEYGETLNAVYQKLNMQPSTQQAVLSENEHVFTTSAAQVRAARRSYGNLPLIVLTSGPGPAPKTPLAPEVQAQRDARFKVKVGLRDSVAKLSDRGVNEVVQDSGHYIQVEKPGAVIDAINRVLAMAK